MAIFSKQTRFFVTTALLLCSTSVVSEAWSQEIEIRPGLSPVLVKADQLLKAGRGDSAAAVLNEYVIQHPDQPQALLRLADIATRRWEYPKAQGYLEQALRIDPKGVDALAELGRLYYEESVSPLNPVDRMSKSEGYLNQALGLNPNHVRSLTYMGNWELQQNDLVSAERHYRQAIALNPKFIPAYQGLTRFYIKAKDFVQARDAITQALELDNRDSTSYFLVAQLLAVADHPADAVKYGQQAEVLDFGKNVNRDYFMATQLDKLGESQQAIAYYQKVLADFPKHGPSWERLGQLYEVLKQPEQSIQAYRQAIAIDPGFLNTLIQQARQAMRQENWPGAIDRWQRVRSIETTPNPNIDVLLSNIQYAQSLGGQPIQGLPISHPLHALKQSLAKPGSLPGDIPDSIRSELTGFYNDPSPLNRLEAAFLAGDFKKAKAELEGIDGLSADDYQDAGDRLAMLHDYQAARTFYQRALEIMKAEGSTLPENQSSLVTALKRIEQQEKTAQRLVEDGNLLYDNKSYVAAVEKYEAALRTDPLSETAYLRLADAYERNKQKDRAFWAYHQVVEINPSLMDSTGFSKKYTQLEKNQPKAKPKQ